LIVAPVCLGLIAAASSRLQIAEAFLSRGVVYAFSYCLSAASPFSCQTVIVL
jgi:hypothetical protein